MDTVNLQMCILINLKLQCIQFKFWVTGESLQFNHIPGITLAIDPRGEIPLERDPLDRNPQKEIPDKDSPWQRPSDRDHPGHRTPLERDPRRVDRDPLDM